MICGTRIYTSEAYGAVIVSITGTPGTGKTTASKILSKILGLQIINLNELLSNEFAIERDAERDTLIVDVERAVSEFQFPKEAIVDGHLSHFVRSNFVIVLRCKPKNLYQRLQSKAWSVNKTEENVEAEALNIIAGEAYEMNDKVFEIDTTNKTPNEVVEDILKAIKGKLKSQKYDFLEYL
ncbi:MAG: AAA family ATPase [Candidatus Altiarchaeota archaeon]|nr:AAA family ATPase [Candidatus Altiarchaeota archaeon]